MKLSEMDYLHKNDYTIRIRPFQHENGEWTGEIDVAIVTGEDNDLSDEDYSQILHLTKMVASSIPVMEYNEDLRDAVHDFVEQHVDQVDVQFEPEEDLSNKVVDRDENIIKIDFSTRTKGSA